jgi:hypothetical protein
MKNIKLTATQLKTIAGEAYDRLIENKNKWIKETFETKFKEDLKVYDRIQNEIDRLEKEQAGILKKVRKEFPHIRSYGKKLEPEYVHSWNRKEGVNSLYSKLVLKSIGKEGTDIEKIIDKIVEDELKQFSKYGK